MNCSRTAKNLSLCCASTLALTVGVSAQEYQPVDQRDQGLDTIIVTAEKRAESLQDVPVSVSALSSSEIDGLKLRDSAEIATQIPNLQVTNPTGDGFPIFSLRGVSMSDYSLNQSSPVASYVDEVYKGNPAIQGVQIYDLERIEVLRGPQGTLYGKNSTGGAVNFITKRPSMDSGGYLTVGAGNYNRYEVKGAVETPLVEDTLAVRVAGTWTKANGWFDNILPSLTDGGAINEYGVRGTILWRPTDRFEVLLRASTGKQEAVNYGIQPFNISAEGVGAGLYSLYNLLGATTAVDATRAGLEYFEFDSDQDMKRRVQNDAVALTISWDVSDTLTVTSITSWDDGEFLNPEDADGTINVVVQPRYYANTEQISQDLRLTSSFDGPFDFIGGFYFADEDVFNSTDIGFYRDLDLNADGNTDYLDCVDVLQTSLGVGPATPDGSAMEGILNGFGASLGDFAPAGCIVRNEFNQRRTSFAGYFNSSYDVTDALTFRLGVRYTRDKSELTNFSGRLLGSDETPIANTIPGDPIDPFAIAADDAFVDKEWSGKAGLDYTTLSGALLYASYSRGYRSGAFNAQAFFDPSELTKVEPETLNSFEVGFKTRFLDDRIQLNGAAFYYQYKNQQFLNVDAMTLAQTLVNIDKSRVYGGELELLARPAPELLFQAGIGVLDSEVVDGLLSGIDLSGNELVLSPRVNFNTAIDWDVWENSAGVLMLHVDASYISQQYFEIFNVDRLQQEGYSVANARLQFELDGSSLQFAVWVKNMFDQEYRTSVIDLQASFGYDYSHIGAPRTFGGEITYRF